MRRYTATDFQAAMYGPDPRSVELAYLQSRLGPQSVLLAQSQPLTGDVFTEQGAMRVTDAVAAFDVGAVLYRFGTWVVTEHGIACLVHHYPISQAQIQQRDDIAPQLAEQSWVNLWDLLRALAVAGHPASAPPQGGGQGNETHPS
jgi:hypothetical protein